MPRRASAAVLALLACAACDGREDRAAAPPSERRAPTPPADPLSAEDPCVAEIESIVAPPPDPEVAAYYAAVPRIVLKAKLVPVLYASAPPADADPRAVALRERLAAAGAGAERALRREIDAAHGDRALLRAAFLRDGYLFCAEPELAAALVKLLELGDLFDDPIVFRDRGRGVERLARDGDGYAEAGGGRAGLLLNDRLARTEAELAAPRHFDLGAVQAATDADRVAPLVVAADRAAVRLTYPTGRTTAAVIARAGFTTAVACVEGAPQELAADRRIGAALRGWHARVRDAAQRLVAERPGFDEPADEVEGEQEDGVLRHEWEKAYLRREKTFFYREREYPVFDRRGNPTPPEVCIDFVFDAWERASGRWFAPRSQRPGRTIGFLDFTLFPGLWRRHIPSLLEYAAASPLPLDRYDLPPADIAPLKAFDGMAAALARNAGAFAEGDVLVIHGIREEDGEEHYHAVIVIEADPLSGLPIVVADNAGRPRVRTLAAAMRNAPRRAVKHRLRLNAEWLLERLGGAER